MSTPRVLIVWHNPLFQATVKAILTRADIQSITLVPAEQALETALAIRPNTIVVEGGPSQAVPFLQHLSGNVSIFAFTLDDNRVHLYRHEEWRGLTGDALVHAILAEERP